MPAPAMPHKPGWNGTTAWADRIFKVHPFSMLRVVRSLTIPTSREWGYYLRENKTTQNPNNPPPHSTKQPSSTPRKYLVYSFKLEKSPRISAEAKVLALLCWLCCCCSLCEAGWALPCTGESVHTCPKAVVKWEPPFCIHCPALGSFSQGPTILKNQVPYPATSSVGFLSTYLSGLSNHNFHKLWVWVLKTDLCW